ncbi:MAG TPA: hypothetical protein VJT73_13450 [Polyangiaceae bacterium]|nr:hypothetical protein [Polyangiaceae bacterium]
MGRFRMALRTPVALAPVGAFFVLKSTEPVWCAALVALVLVLATFFRWRTFADGRAATAGLVLGWIANGSVVVLRVALPGWTIADNAAPALCAIVMLVVGQLCFMRSSSSEGSRRDDVHPIRGATIAGLLAGLSFSMFCIGGGVGALAIAAAGTAWGVVAGAASLRTQRV